DLALGEPLGTEEQVVRVGRLRLVSQDDRGGDVGAGRRGDAAGGGRRLQGGDRHRDDRVQAHRLLEDRLQVVVVAGRGCLARLLLLRRVLAELVQRPGQGGRGGLVTGEEQR